VGENSSQDLAALCEGAPQNCELLSFLQDHHAQRCHETGIGDKKSIVDAMAVGLVVEVWRNGPVEDMHSSRRGPDDAAIFAESTALHGEAVKALASQNTFWGLLDFETHLLSRERPWAGTDGKTLRDLGYGFLGSYRRHVMDRINALINLGHHTCVDDPLQVYLVNRALMSGRDHKGMPGWQTIVERIGIMLADPSHPAWREGGLGVRALAQMPAQTPPAEELITTLLVAPFLLPNSVLEWLSRFFLHCAGPPYTWILE
jgi:hypothetical protein